MFNGRFGPWKKFGKMAEKVPQVSAWYNIGHWVINTKNQTRPLLLLTVHNPKTKQIQIQSWPNKPPKPNLYLNKTWVDLSQTHYPVSFSLLSPSPSHQHWVIKPPYHPIVLATTSPPTTATMSPPPLRVNKQHLLLKKRLQATKRLFCPKS